jgi:hypothetical protein
MTRDAGGGRAMKQRWRPRARAGFEVGVALFRAGLGLAGLAGLEQRDKTRSPDGTSPTDDLDRDPEILENERTVTTARAILARPKHLSTSSTSGPAHAP